MKPCINYQSDYRPEMEQIEELVRLDTSNICPEACIMVDCQHTALGLKQHERQRNVDFNCNIATRYYEDKKYARAYALMAYECGIAIIADKTQNLITTLVLGEDDGVWFVNYVNKGGVDWIYTKSNFISLMAEALSTFNNNYKE